MPIISYCGDWERSLAETRADLDKAVVARRQGLRSELVKAADALLRHIRNDVGALGTNRLNVARCLGEAAAGLDPNDPGFPVAARPVRADLERLADDVGAAITIREPAPAPAVLRERLTNRDVLLHRAKRPGEEAVVASETVVD